MAIVFNEIDEWYSIPNTADMDLPDGDWCIGIWTRVTALSGAAWEYLLSNNTYNGTPAFNLYVSEASDNWLLNIKSDNGASTGGATSTDAPGADSVWRLVIVQRDTTANEFQLWFCTFSGTPSKQIADSDAGYNGVTGQAWNIGRRTDGNADRYYGNEAAEFFKVDAALSSAEIKALGAGVTIWELGYTPDVYLPMRSAEATLVDLFGSNDATRNGSPATVEHPPVLPSSPGSSPWVGAGATTVTPVPADAVVDTVNPDVTATTTSTYKLCIDLDDDLSFGSGDDITDYVLRADWALGLSAWDHIAGDGFMALRLNNADKRFSPENTSSPYYDAARGETKLMPLRGVRLTMDTGGGETIMWTGLIDYLDVEPGTLGDRRVTIHCIDNMALVRNRNLIGIDVMTDARSDEVIAAILDLQTRGSWLIGIPDISEIGSSTFVGGSRFGYSKICTGQRTFLFAGDDWFTEQTVYGKALEEVVKSEGWPSRFFFDRDGDPVFWDINYLQALNDTPLAINADDALRDMKYLHGKQVYNEVIVQMNPRVAGTPGTVLYSNEGQPVRLAANGGSRTVRARYIDENNNRIGASALISLTIGTDFTLNTEDDGSGSNYTTGYVAYAAPRGDYADIVIQNNNDVALYVIDLQLRGTPLKHFNPTDIKARHNESVSRYGLRQLQYSAPLLDDVDLGMQIANYMVNMRGVPLSEVGQIAIDSGTSTKLGYIEDKTIGDAISLSETQTSLSSKSYIIVGERHSIRDKSYHLATWLIEPTALYQSWLVGVAARSEIGETTFMGI